MTTVPIAVRSFIHLGAMAEGLESSLLAGGWQRIPVATLTHVSAALRKAGSRVALLDLGDGDATRLRDVAALIARHTDVEWLAQVAPATLDGAALREVIYSSFFDFCTAPLDVERLKAALGHAWGMSELGPRVDAESQAGFGLGGMVGESPAIRTLLTQLRKLAPIDVPILITGESGTGKEIAARNLHALSPRKHAPFVAINCGGLSEKLIPSELFGHERGAFTGATARKIGRIEAAAGGSVFLDEIGDLPLDAQASLLRFLQEGTIERVGSHVSIKVDARVIAATHVDLERAVAEGRFRQDLYYRLNVLRLRMPPLRERSRDVEHLARYFLDRYARELGIRIRGYSLAALRALSAHPWPGNVRELMNRVRRAVVLCESGLIRPADLELDGEREDARMLSLDEARTHAERETIVRCLQETRFNVSECARRLQVSRVTLYRLCKKLEVSLG